MHTTVVRNQHVLRECSSRYLIYLSEVRVPMCRFGFVKFKTRAAAADALEKLAGKQLADFPGQNVGPSLLYHKIPTNHGRVRCHFTFL